MSQNQQIPKQPDCNAQEGERHLNPPTTFSAFRNALPFSHPSQLRSVSVLPISHDRTVMGGRAAWSGTGPCTYHQSRECVSTSFCRFSSGVSGSVLFSFFVPLFGFCVIAGCHEARAACIVACRLGRLVRVRHQSPPRHGRRLELHVNIRRGETWAAFT